MSVKRDRGCSATQSQPLFKARIWVNLPCVHQGIANTCSARENALRGRYYGNLHFSLVSAYHRGVMYAQCAKLISFPTSSSSHTHPFFFFFLYLHIRLLFPIFSLFQPFLIFTFLCQWKLSFFLSQGCFQMEFMVYRVTWSVGSNIHPLNFFNRKPFEPHFLPKQSDGNINDNAIEKGEKIVK